ncbi:hypothetical protein [Moorena bouillonii]|nr:hypothetical protein [Moorena bouillonii]
MGKNNEVVVITRFMRYTEVFLTHPRSVPDAATPYSLLPTP